MSYPDPKDILVLHARIIEATTGSDGVRDMSMFLSACARPEANFGGKDLYTTVFEKAAALMESLANNHAFIDGNKRTAFAAAALLLHMNGFELNVPKQKTVVAFMLQVATGRVNVKDIAVWLKKHSRKVEA